MWPWKELISHLGWCRPKVMLRSLVGKQTTDYGGEQESVVFTTVQWRWLKSLYGRNVKATHHLHCSQHLDQSWRIEIPWPDGRYLFGKLTEPPINFCSFTSGPGKVFPIGEEPHNLWLLLVIQLVYETIETGLSSQSHVRIVTEVFTNHMLDDDPIYVQTLYTVPSSLSDFEWTVEFFKPVNVRADLVVGVQECPGDDSSTLLRFLSDSRFHYVNKKRK